MPFTSEEESKPKGFPVAASYQKPEEVYVMASYVEDNGDLETCLKYKCNLHPDKKIYIGGNIQPFFSLLLTLVGKERRFLSFISCIGKNKRKNNLVCSL